MTLVLGDICAIADIGILTTVVVIIIAGIIFYGIYKRKYTYLYVSSIIIFLLSFNLTSKALEPSLLDSYIEDETKGISVYLTGTVGKIVEKDTYTQIYLKNNKITLESDNHISTKVKGILLTTSKTSSGVGDVIEVKGELKQFLPPRNEGEFDSKTYYSSINVNYKCSGDVISIIQKNNSELLQTLFAFKAKLKDTYQNIAVGEDAGIYDSIVLGDKQELNEDISTLYQKNGIAHLLAISGLHISIIGMTLYKCLRKIGLLFLPCAIISGIVISCYGVITGNGISTVRAMIMFWMAVTAGTLGRTYDITSALSMAAIVLLLDSPLLILNCGFLLSFSAILGIIILYPAIKTILNLGKTNVVISCVIDSLLVSSCVNLSTLPVILYFYYEIPIYSVVLNAIVIPLMTFVMMSTVVAGVLGMLFYNAGVFLIGMAHYIVALYEILCNAFARLPNSNLIIGKPSGLGISIYIVGLITLIIYTKIAARLYRGIIIVIPVLLMMMMYTHYGELTIKMIDVGQGDSIFVRADNTTYLFDGGSSDVKKVAKYRIIPLLKSQGVRKLDYVIISHMDSDHINGIQEMLEENCGIKISNIVLPNIKEKDEMYIQIENSAREKKINIIYMSSGKRIEDKKMVSIECLHPSENFHFTSTNGYSATYLLSYEDFDMLFTGDLEVDGERCILSNQLLVNVDVLKVAHHGSQTSSSPEFLQKVTPEISLISAGIHNKYGHPHKLILERLNNIQSDIYATNECGEISIVTDGHSLEIERFIKTN